VELDLQPPGPVRGRPRGEEHYASEIICGSDRSVIVAGMLFLDLRPVQAGEQPSASGYKVLEPIRHGSLTVFPVVAPKSYATGEFLTLDEGLRSGEVVVTEYGNVRGLVRRGPAPAVRRESAEVNRLVLINNSKRPLLLLAGEIVTGGKQDRVIGKDRIVPAESDPVDLSVFCVEPGRWVATSEHFGTSGRHMEARSETLSREVRGGVRHAYGRNPRCGQRRWAIKIRTRFGGSEEATTGNVDR